eukprot:gene15760-biopygen2431
MPIGANAKQQAKRNKARIGRAGRIALGAFGAQCLRARFRVLVQEDVPKGYMGTTSPREKSGAQSIENATAEIAAAQHPDMRVWFVPSVRRNYRKESPKYRDVRKFFTGDVWAGCFPRYLPGSFYVPSAPAARGVRRRGDGVGEARRRRRGDGKIPWGPSFARLQKLGHLTAETEKWPPGRATWVTESPETAAFYC